MAGLSQVAALDAAVDGRPRLACEPDEPCEPPSAAALCPWYPRWAPAACHFESAAVEQLAALGGASGVGALQEHGGAQVSSVEQLERAPDEWVAEA
jgi:hypothetical protein